MGKQRKANSSTSFAASLKVTRRPNKTSDRERERVRGLSRAFSRLKTTLPWVPADTKLSKLDTLKLASWYISYLVNLLKKDQEKSRDNCNRDANSQSESLSWPTSLCPRSPLCTTAITQTAAWPEPLDGLASGTFWGARRRNKMPRANQDSLQRNKRHSDDKKTKLPFNTSSITPVCERSSDDGVSIS